MKTSNPWLFEAPFSLEATHYTNPYVTAEAEREWLFEALPTSPTIPTLIRTESTPFNTTLYVSLDLGYARSSPACPRPMTGIFIPENYSATDNVDLILYLQGHHTHNIVKGKAPVRGYYPSNLTINQYWNKAAYPFFALREGVNASGKNAILVAPTLGPRSQTGNLVKPGGFDAYLDQVMAALSAYSPYKGRQLPRVGHIILACHSGGGLPMRQIALSKEKYAANIRECWGFDCTYNGGDDTGWARWAKTNSSRRLYIYYINIDCPPPKKPSCSTKAQAVSLQAKAKHQRLHNVFVSRSTTGSHNEVPITYWQPRIRAASFLQNR
jgi:hypothetical protein